MLKLHASTMLSRNKFEGKMNTLPHSNLRLHGQGAAPFKPMLMLGASLIAMAPLPAFAQLADDATPPQRWVVDERGVNLATGQANVLNVPISIGTNGQGMAFGGMLGIRRELQYSIEQISSTELAAVVGGTRIKFTLSGSTWVNAQGGGETLVATGNIWSGGSYTLTMRDGTVAFFDQSPIAGVAVDEIKYFSLNAVALAKYIIKPGGEKISFYYKNMMSGSLAGERSNIRLISAVSSNGFMAKLEYAGATLSDGYSNFFLLTKATLINLSVDYCDPAADSCTSLTQQWPSVTYATSSDGSQKQQTDLLGRTITYTTVGTQQVKIRRASSSTDNEIISYAYSSGANRVSSITVDGSTWQYAWSSADPVMTVTVTNPDTTQHVVTVDTNQNQVLTYRDELNATTTYQYDSNGRLTYAVGPGGTITSGVPTAGYTKYTYDARGNVKETRKVSKTPGTPADIVTTASYPSTCANLKTCNQPTWTRDALGHQTDYTYNATHGGLLTVTAPADASGVRPQTRYSYTAMQAYYKNSSGSIVASGINQYQLTATSTCLSATSANPASCVGSANESKRTVSYGPQTAGTANNLFPVSSTASAGNGSVTTTVSSVYDNVGNVVSVDGPLSGTGDTTVYRYDAARELVGVVSPDPDGTGSRIPLAQRTTYNVDGQVTMVETGTVADQSDTAWNNFSSLQQTSTTYDGNARAIKMTVTAGGTTYALSQQSYDNMGRVKCTVVRMDPTQWSSQSDACTPQTSGAYGPDRVAKPTYDAVGRVLTVTTGLGTSASAVTQTAIYTTDGLLASVKDANNNKTTYTYDGFDRLSKTNYPSSTKGAGSSSSTDYEQLTYGDNVHVTSLRLRDGSSMSLAYDNLDRIVTRTPPGETAISYTYNLAGQPTLVTQGSVNLTSSYDALGRMTSEAQAFGSMSYQYDTAGNPIRLTWGDGFYVNYDYDNTGQITKIRENGATSGVGVLAQYGYDNLGRRSTITFGNGTTRTYAWDTISRLSGLQVNLAGTTSDLTIGKVGSTGTAIAYNPASQIIGLARSNSAYAYTGGYAVNRNYTANGLNQYTAAGATSFGYDTRGNLTTSGSSTYSYSKLNLLTSAPGCRATFRLRKRDKQDENAAFRDWRRA
ncbi:RHS repeat domain-containing protein [Novosphingobium mangrovi (ex Huang et al. 2023)]|uniref:Teneurin-like YD-shell domain-containing protein n=1 Tax=Novosphingobium mangrovi (ex Huang et al. 2023) TaxID=2976432 RepID=A0ABT2I487_9SPHN|nr:hypothetical protein [Novosphingobium mangrovi (ex Huang et al. 2023)]MCT2399615.1 hypothetical protein [Novosphingobium mangrovi (ex Huang et al. 2023)]